ncbi:MAG: alpha/beta hydrolase [Capnocytophaga sp.]|nr:alpha/beta hydrolase [Capnocytophaga sp.]
MFITLRKSAFLLCLLTFSVITNAQQKLRYFSQEKDVKGSEIPYGNNPKVGKYAQTVDAKIYYETYGKGSPIVILHGGGVGSAYEMGQFIDLLTPTHLVIVISTRGHGKSELGSQKVTLEQRATDVLTVVSAVTQDPVTIIGFSDGAYAGYKFASMYPKKIKQLVAIGAGEVVQGLRTIGATYAMLESLDKAYWQQQKSLMPQPERVPEVITTMMAMYNTTNISKELFMSIQCPVLVVSGEKDANAPLETILNAYRMIPNAQLSIIPNAPHTVFLTNFPAVREAMKPFLNL